jgi:anti-anti-sigma regulatory factor
MTKNTQELKNELDRLKLILNAQQNIVVVTNGKELLEANQAFFDFFEINNLESFLVEHDCICDFFIQTQEMRYLQKIYPDGTSWAKLVINEPDAMHKAMIKDASGQNRIFAVKGNKLIGNEIDFEQEVITFTDITTMENQSILISNMEIPILEINDTTTLIPLIGILDSIKSQKLMENILMSIKEKAIKTTIIDIEGILVVDSAVAAHLIKITKATKLMGCITILSGIAPEVAQTIVNLGINLDGIYTTSTLKDALKLENEK